MRQVSLGVVLAGVGMLYGGWIWLDPAMSLVIAAVIVGSTWGLLRDSLDLSLHAVPPRIDAARIRAYLRGWRASPKSTTCTSGA